MSNSIFRELCGNKGCSWALFSSQSQILSKFSIVWDFVQKNSKGAFISAQFYQTPSLLRKYLHYTYKRNRTKCDIKREKEKESILLLMLHTANKVFSLYWAVQSWREHFKTKSQKISPGWDCRYSLY